MAARDERMGPAGDAPEPARWEEPAWEGRDRLQRASDALDVATLWRYLRDGHPYRLAMRSGIAVQWIGPGQYVFFARIDDSDRFWHIQHELKARRDAAGRNGAGNA